MGPKPTVGITDAQIKKHFQIWEKENSKETWMNAKSCNTAAAERVARQNLPQIQDGKADNSNCRFFRLKYETTKHSLCDCETLVNSSRLTLGMDSIEEPCLKTEIIRGLLHVWKKLFGYNLEPRGKQREPPRQQ